MKTTITSGQMSVFLRLLEQQDVNPERFQEILESGFLSDLLDPASVLDERDLFRATLKTHFNLEGYRYARIVRLQKMIYRGVELSAALASMGLRAATSKDLMLFRDTYPRQTEEYKVLLGYDGNDQKVPSFDRGRGIKWLIWDRDLTQQYHILTVSLAL
jgi:hypothetical protein